MRIEIARARPTDRSVAIIPLTDSSQALPTSLDERERACCQADIVAVGFRAESGAVLDVSAPSGSPFSRILLIGVTCSADRVTAGWEQLGGHLPRQAARLHATALTVILPDAPLAALDTSEAARSIANMNG